MKVDVDWPEWPVAAAASVNVVVGRNPPSNQPQDWWARFSRSPMFVPPNATASRVEQSSQYGCASLVSEKPPLPSGVISPFGEVDVETEGFLAVWLMSTLPVSPAVTLMAPGAEGPKVTPNELSDIE